MQQDENEQASAPARTYPDEVDAEVSYGGTPLRIRLPLNPYGEGKDPETGLPIESAAHARKLAITHYGVDPIPVNSGTLLARSRRAMLMGEPLPER